ncbi:E3 ubiquitin-protein ligase TRIM21-like isoform X1 [Genypterus blacodes]|uniref:E3 ubiquitin-protein ligase TRIM21-like isoform X1 n=1 Tax=Genypterus blacodes TaxID=154954 RepID=UPI003F76F0F8
MERAKAEPEQNRQTETRIRSINIEMGTATSFIFRTNDQQEDDVVCDICTGTMPKAEKSCLTCSASYCSSHLEHHNSIERLRSHKLVNPVKNLDERACPSHGLPLELYNREWHRCICVRCIEGGVIVSTEDECIKKKDELSEVKYELMQQIRMGKMKVDETDASLKGCLDQVDSELQETEHVFTTAIATLEEAMLIACKPLKDRRRAVQRDAQELTEDLQNDIRQLERTVSEMDHLSAIEDHFLFLQRYPSLSYPESRDWTEVALDSSLSFGSMRKIRANMMDKLHHQLEELSSTELRRAAKFRVDVKLDPSTSHAQLVISEDGKEVKDRGEIQEVPDTPERFNLFASILGGNPLVSGRSYWEVDVSDKTGWDLGVARVNANRRGKLSLSPEIGFWVLVHYDSVEYAATDRKPVHLSVNERPQKVGVFVDHDEGIVSFYDANAQSHIYSFTECPFDGEIVPYFSPHLRGDGRNAAPLIIC